MLHIGSILYNCKNEIYIILKIVKVWDKFERELVNIWNITERKAKIGNKMHRNWLKKQRMRKNNGLWLAARK